MSSLWVIANFGWAAALFIGAVVVGVVMGSKMSRGHQIGLAAVFVLMSAAAGFGGTGVFWVSEAGRGRGEEISIHRLYEGSKAASEARVDQVCRAAMKTVQPISEHTKRYEERALDLFYVELAESEVPRRRYYSGTAAYRAERNVAVYALGPNPGSSGEGEAGRERVYFELEPRTFELVRAYTKKWEDGKLVEVALYDRAVSR